MKLISHTNSNFHRAGYTVCNLASVRSSTVTKAWFNFVSNVRHLFLTVILEIFLMWKYWKKENYFRYEDDTHNFIALTHNNNIICSKLINDCLKKIKQLFCNFTETSIRTFVARHKKNFTLVQRQMIRLLGPWIKFGLPPVHHLPRQRNELNTRVICI